MNHASEPQNVDNPGEVNTGKHWRRLAPVALLYFIASNIKSTVQSALYIIPALAISVQTTSVIDTQWFWPAVCAIIALIVISGIVSYLFYQFRVRNSHVEIRTGLFNRRHINLPFWRIQNVKVERPFYYRPTQFAVVVLDTAGSAKEEAKIVAVTQRYANRLRAQILNERTEFLQNEESAEAREPVEDTESVSQSPGQDTVINRRSLSDLVIHGITNNRVWIILGALAPFYDDLAGMVSDWLSRHGLQLEQLVGSSSVTWWQWGLYAFTIMMLIMALMALLSIGGSLLTYYGYTLTRSDDRYVRKSGLLSQQEVSMRQSRVQMVAVKQDWLDRVLKRANVFFEQNKTGNQQNQELMAPNKLLVPSVTLPEAGALCEEVLPDSRLFSQTFSPVTPFYLAHHLLVRLFPVAVIVALILILEQQWQALSVAVTAAVVVSIAIWLRYKRWGVARDDNYIYVRSGIIGEDFQVFPLYKVQQVVIKQSVMMKRRQLASIKFVLASGSVTVPFLKEVQVRQLANLALADVERSARSWM
ncbi:PH domain-containing protein [Salinimonas sp. HHU 13199]|uniref:PH domain-containing protein n=1 Tax=Salinimonas profundi TaxID=2729140 RepID=A0ABR8LM90_9ALTE|nr:PH domain-containing protein [Salinimonas profundi]MBD3586176.1 PH domain-containing protein [Salinimonas profundi]